MILGRMGVLLILVAILMAVTLGQVIPAESLLDLMRVAGALGLTGMALCMVALGVEAYGTWAEAQGEQEQEQDGDA